MVAIYGTLEQEIFEMPDPHGPTAVEIVEAAAFRNLSLLLGQRGEDLRG